MKRIDWNALDERERAVVLQRPVQAVSDAVRSGVAAIFDAVAADGDAALRAYTQQFDGVALEDFEVDAAEFDAARDQVPVAVQAAITEAAGRIEAFHLAGIATPYEVETAPGLLCQRVQRPITRVGLYVPAGSAPLPSTALMLTIPARLAGCIEIILCTPPRKDGSADPAVDGADSARSQQRGQLGHRQRFGVFLPAVAIRLAARVAFDVEVLTQHIEQALHRAHIALNTRV